ncbi:FtsB family cell division protein [Pseudactinotalea sp. Z1748]|uniref:FtsB family cell division protein n=1 Tax=Pseudactinotalea sp. Z1748 TaxID=3413027 RepID=UPI003C7AB493
MSARRPTTPRAPSRAPASKQRGGADPATRGGRGHSGTSGSRPRPSPGKTARAPQRGAGRAAVVDPEPPPRQITVRTLVLFLVVLMAFIVVTPTLRAYVTQAEQQRTLVAQIEATEERNIQLQRTVDRWEDPAYVQAQARERLGFVHPGETAYLVVDPEVVTGEEVESDPDADGPVLMPQVGPWYITVTDSLRVAGEVGEE